MQAVRPPAGDRNPNEHTEETILAALQGRAGSRRFSFRYDLLDAGNVFVDDVTEEVTDCKISMNWLADIKRTATISMRESGLVDFLSDRIKPYVRLHLPPYGAGDYVEWPQGVFLLATPVRTANERNAVDRAIECYDPLKAFVDDKVTFRYTVAAGASYITAINALLGSIPKSVVPSSKVLTAAYEREPGTMKLTIINELLNAINYESLSFDEDGTAIVRPYRDPDLRPEEYLYSADDRGLLVPSMDEEFDLFDVANKWTVVVSDPDRPALTSSYTNTDPASPTSTVRRQRTIVDFRTEEDAPDQATLDAKVRRLAFEASQIYQALEFSTALMPLHSGNDVYRIQYAPLAINAKYTEQTWSMTLKAGAPMSHRARRVVSV